MNKTYKYTFAANHELIIEAHVTDAKPVNHDCPMEDAEEECDAECDIESITLNGEYFEADGLYVVYGDGMFGKPVYQDLEDAIKDAILAGDCD